MNLDRYSTDRLQRLSNLKNVGAKQIFVSERVIRDLPMEKVFIQGAGSRKLLSAIPFHENVYCTVCPVCIDKKNSITLIKLGDIIVDVPSESHERLLSKANGEAIMPSSTYAVFRDAVLKRKQVVCMYQGYERQLCPHVLGYKDGREKVLSFQFGGGSSKGLPHGGQWRCMFLEEITDARAQDGDWYTGTGHSRIQTCVDDVDVEVAF